MNFFNIFLAPPVGSLTVQSAAFLESLPAWIETVTNYKITKVVVSESLLNALPTNHDVTVSLDVDRMVISYGEESYDLFAGLDDSREVLYITTTDDDLWTSPNRLPFPVASGRCIIADMPVSQFTHLNVSALFRSFTVGLRSSLAPTGNKEAELMISTDASRAFFDPALAAASRARLNLTNEVVVELKDGVKTYNQLVRWSLVTNLNVKLNGSVVTL